MKHHPRASLGFLAASLIVGACHGDRSPTTPQDQSEVRSEVLTLRIGDVAYVDDIEIRFADVPRDIRCAGDVVCVSAGFALVDLGVGPLRGTDGPTYKVELNTAWPWRDEALGLRLTLLRLSPERLTGNPIPPEEYEIELGVEPAGDSEPQ